MISTLAALILAEAPPPGFDQWLASAAYAMVIITSAVVLWRKLQPQKAQPREISGQPIKVEASLQFTPIERTVRLEETVKEIDSKIDKQAVDLPAQITAAFNSADQKRSTSIAGVHSELRRQGEILSANTAETKMALATIQNVDAKLNRVLERVAERK